MSISELLQMLKTDIDSMSLGEKLLGGFSTALLAMGVVFVILVLISLIIRIINATPKETKVEMSTNVVKVQESEEVVEQKDDAELVAAITAAIMAAGSKNIVVRRITRTNNTQSNWEKTSNIEI